MCNYRQSKYTIMGCWEMYIIYLVNDNGFARCLTVCCHEVCSEDSNSHLESELCFSDLIASGSCAFRSLMEKYLRFGGKHICLI